MAGPNTFSLSSSNLQCLPSDPQYYQTNNPSKALHSSLRQAIYYVRHMPDLAYVHSHYVPCVICETNQRLTTLIVPAMTKCPTSDWHLEYNGYLMSGIEHTGGKENDFTQTKDRASSNYICLDKNAESLTSKPRPAVPESIGAEIFPVDADCTDVEGLTTCPPYQANNVALACVVCSK